MPAINVRFQILRKYNSYTSFNFALLNLTIDMETTYTIKNFRRFDYSGAQVKFSPITFLTGTNGSGKSSIVKSLILLERTIKEAVKNYKSNGFIAPTLDFTDSLLKLGRYDKVFNKSANKGDNMSFEYSINSLLLGEEIFVEYKFIEDKSSKLNNGKLTDLMIRNSEGKVLLHISYNDEHGGTFASLNEESLIYLKDSFKKFALYSIVCFCKEEEKHGQKFCDILQNTESIAISISNEERSKYNQWFDEKEELGSAKYPYKAIDYKAVVSFFESTRDRMIDNPDELINISIQAFLSQYFYCNNLNNEQVLEGLWLSPGYGCFSRFINYFFDEVLMPSFINNIEYLGTSRIAQKRIYLLDDTSNDFGSLFRKFLEQEKYSEAYYNINDYIPGSFMRKWLREFKIAYNIDIKNNSEGQGIDVRLFNSEDDKEGHLLADDGYGITQFISLLLNIEVAICSRQSTPSGKYIPKTLTIEEPEVHLHPRYQSLLADMFLDAYRYYRLHFIVETHSEYLIRRSQVLVAKMGFKTNPEADKESPFRTIYIPEDGTPYNLYYRKDGKFAESFGSGFFDETSKLVFEIL